jgi:hypothetical protein
MSTKARSQLRKEQEAVAQRAASYDNVLKARKDAVPTVPVLTPEDIGRQISSEYFHRVVRPLKTFNHSMKTKDTGKIRLAYASHLYGKYSVGRHLQLVWMSDKYNLKGNEDDKLFYVVAASGGSLYKECTKDFMTKKETHSFLTCPLKITFKEAIWYAFAKAHTDDIGIVTRIFKSKLVEKNYRSVFWKETVRFFCLHPVPIHQMNDMIDYLQMAYGQDAEWSFKGRTPESIMASTQQWHRDLNRVKRLGNARWDGIETRDSQFETEEAKSKVKHLWYITQIKNSKDLAAEGNKMHHCVYSYQSHCIRGRTSIWSLQIRTYPTKDNAFGQWERALTIEILNADQKIVQIRGYANRQPRPHEMIALRQWASVNGFTISHYY